MSPWRVLLRMVPQLTAKLKGLGCRRLRWLVDGEVIYWALLMPEEADLEAHARFPGMPQCSLEGWLRGTLERFEAGWPQARAVEILGVWPDRLERVVRVFPKARAVSSSEECYADPPSS